MRLVKPAQEPSAVSLRGWRMVSSGVPILGHDAGIHEADAGRDIGRRPSRA
ncbi:hypothetical protein CDS [Bradyrhizobium sp.]|nr:hypothetical protein CDS [Bradyrhizobium sp.]